MKITQYRNDGKAQTQRTMDIEAALAAMRTEIKSKTRVCDARKPAVFPPARNRQ